MTIKLIRFINKQRNIMAKYLFFGLLLLLLSSCSDGIVSECETIPTDINMRSNFSSIQTELFDKNCATSGCHVGEFAPASLDLSRGNAYKNIVGVKSSGELMYINQGNSSESYLYQRISSNDVSNVMPPTGRLNQAFIDSLKLWIDNGALNN